MEYKKFKHRTSVRIIYAHTDKMGFVYNGNYLAFFEMARTELMRHTRLPYREFEKAGYQLPLVEAHVNYKRPGYYDDLLEIEARIEFELSARLKIDYTVFRGEEVLCTGYTVHSYMNEKTQKAVRPPKIFVDAMKESGE
jgi:acyl-CoA thioester hydrolase